MKHCKQTLALALCLTIPAGGLHAEDAPVQALGNAKFTGQVNSIYSWNFASPDSGISTLRGFDAIHNEFQINLAKLAVEGAIGERGGYRMDLAFGSDANLIEAAGFPGDDGFSLMQGYVSYALDKDKKYTLMGGKFVTLHGAEVIESAYNLNTSRALAFNYAIPFTHTGLMAALGLSDKVSVKLGLVNGWDNVKDNNVSKTLHLAVLLTPSDKLFVSLGGSYGAEQSEDQTEIEANQRMLLDVVAGFQATEALKLMLNLDYGSEEKANLVDGEEATWTAVAAYVHFQKEKLGLTVRGETFLDNGFSRLGSASGLIDGEGSVSVDEDSLQVSEATVTGHLYLDTGLEFRPEFRADFADQDIFVDADDKATDSQVTLSGELVYAF